MNWSMLIDVGAGLVSATLFSYLFSRTILSRLYSCECDLADLQDRHLRTVRRAAAKDRWDAEDGVDEAIQANLGNLPKPKGWTKWGSSNQLKSSENPLPRP